MMGYRLHYDSGLQSMSHLPLSLLRKVRADGRSIPAIIASTKQSDLDNVLEGPDMDMERHRQLRLKGKSSNGQGRRTGSASYQSTTASASVSASASATPSMHMDTSTATSSTSIKNSGGHHKEVDEFLTNSVPGFNYLGQNPISNSNSSYTSPAGSPAQNESAPIWQDITGPDGSRDQSFWDLINGGTVEDLDFSTFLQNFNEDGSAI